MMARKLEMERNRRDHNLFIAMEKARRAANEFRLAEAQRIAKNKKQAAARKRIAAEGGWMQRFMGGSQFSGFSRQASRFLRLPGRRPSNNPGGYLALPPGSSEGGTVRRTR